MQKELIIVGDTSLSVNHNTTNQSNRDIDSYEVVNKDKVLLLVLKRVSH